MSYEYVKRWRTLVRKRALTAFGNKCGLCGYNKCVQALEFHHINPDEKDFNISGYKVASWSAFVDELKKCVLVCANCHREIHNGVSDVNDISTRYDIAYDIWEENNDAYDSCPGCGRLKSIRHNYCSTACRITHTQDNLHIDWSVIDLVNLIEMYPTYTKIGEIIGVSGVSVRREIVKQGLDVNKIRNVNASMTRVELDNMNSTRIELILSSDIDFARYGWVSKVSQLFGITPQKVTPWMKRHMLDFYTEKCFIKRISSS